MASSYSGPYTGPVGQVGLSDRQGIVEAVVGPVEWAQGGDWGYCSCPGAQFHHNKSGRRDCRAFAAETARDGSALPPGVYCLHTSCASAIEEASRRIRSEIGKAKVKAADTRVRMPAGRTPTPTAGSRTARTGVWGLADKKGGLPRTVRTDVSRPIALYAHTHAHTPEAPKSAKEPSAPSAPVAQPARELVQPKPKDDDKPGQVTLWIKGEPITRGVMEGKEFKPIFTFKDTHND